MAKDQVGDHHDEDAGQYNGSATYSVAECSPKTGEEKLHEGIAAGDDSDHQAIGAEFFSEDGQDGNDQPESEQIEKHCDKQYS